MASALDEGDLALHAGSFEFLWVRAETVDNSNLQVCACKAHQRLVGAVYSIGVDIFFTVKLYVVALERQLL